MTNILLTGASGFLGAAVAEDLRKDYEIVALGRSPLSLPAVRNIAADLSKPLDTALLPRKIDAVLHLAQSRLYRDPSTGAADMLFVNVCVTANLLQWARDAGAKSFVYASTGSVYGQGYGVGSETDPIVPSTDLYTATKYAGESLTLAGSSPFAASALRFFTLYGPGQTQKLIAGIIERVMAGAPIQIEGERGFETQPTFIADAVAVVRAALEQRWTGIVNVAGPETVGIRHIAEVVSKRLGKEPIFEKKVSLPTCIKQPSMARLRLLMPGHEFVTLEDGIERTLSGLTRP